MISFDFSLDHFLDIAAKPLNTWPGTLMVAAVAVLFAVGLHRVGSRILQRIARPYPLMSVVLRYISKPALLLLIILGLGFVLVEAPDSLPFAAALSDLLTVLLIVVLTFLAVRSVGGVAEAIVQAHPLDSQDNLQARRIHTQARVLARSVMVVIVIIGFGGALMTFPAVRQIGASLLASAGVAGLVAGIAARPVLGNLIAGLQIALSQPIRLDDVVVIQGEWGRVEEITGTYVSIRIWDQRRLIVPLQWFYRESVHELDTEQLADYRYGVFLCRLPDAGRADARGTRTVVATCAGMGWARAGPSSDRCHRKVDAVARAGQFVRLRPELGSALPRARGLAEFRADGLSAVFAANAGGFIAGRRARRFRTAACAQCVAAAIGVESDGQYGSRSSGEPRRAQRAGPIGKSGGEHSACAERRDVRGPVTERPWWIAASSNIAETGVRRVVSQALASRR